MGSDDKLWSKLGSQIEALIPSAYAGIVLVVVAMHFEPQFTHSLIENVGSVLVIPVVLFVGLFFHLVYRVILGELVLYPVRHFLLSSVDHYWRKTRKKPDEFISFTRLLAKHGVAFGFRRQVYSSIRHIEGVLDQSLRDRFDLLHATYHFFYITSLEFLVAGVYARYYKGVVARPYFLVGALFLVFAFIADFRQDIWECRLLRAKENEIDELLVRIGYHSRRSN